MSKAIHLLFSVLSFSVVSGLTTNAGENPAEARISEVHEEKNIALGAKIHELETMNDAVFTFDSVFTLEALTEARFSKIKLIYIFSAFLTGGICIAIYHSRGFVTVCAILAYVGALSTMSMLIRNCFVNQNFQYPQFLTATHFVATATLGSSILLYRRITQDHEIKIPDMNCVLKGLLPVAGAMVLSLGFSNVGLLLTNAHFYEMSGSSTALCTAGLSVLIGKGFDMRLMPPLCLITGSLIVIAFGEIQLSLLGLLACAGGVIMRSVKSIVQNSLMSGSEWKAMDPVEVAVWTSSCCFVLMSAWSISSEGFAPYKQIQNWGTFTAVLYTCIGASILNIAALFVLRELGPVAQQIVGQMKGVLAIVGAVAMQGEQITLQGAIGYSILLCGIFWYNTTDQGIKKEKEKALKEADETTKIQTA